MSVFALRRKRNTRPSGVQAPPSAPAAPPVPCGWNAAGEPLVRDAAGIRPATAGEIAAARGIAVRATLDRIRAQAQAEAELAEVARRAAPAAPWGPWDHPGGFPGAMNGRPADWHGHDLTSLDNPPAHTRPYIPGDLGRPQRMSLASASVRDDLAGCVIFREAVGAEIVRRDAVRGTPATDGTWDERYEAAFEAARERLAGAVDAAPLPDFRISELMHKNFAGMLAMNVRTGHRAAAA